MESRVETASGTVRGTRRGDTHVFRGIPYARPPVGELRWRPPEPAEPWTGVRDATHAGPIAPQTPSPMESMLSARRHPMDEDCLTVNVWTPAPDDGRRPVMVWIHGGAFVTGSGAMPWYDGTALAHHGDVVVVTLNYRLGTLGFLHLADLGGEAFASSGNLGLLDQIAALRWVRDNVAAFGGDPGQVTVFGESAGAMSVASLLGLPAAAGLFRRAIAQSGAASHVTDRERGTAIAVRFLDALGLDAGHLDELRRLPVNRLLEAQAAVLASAGTILAFQPVVDGTTIPRSPLDAVAAGEAAGIDLLTGTTRDEMRLFAALDPRLANLDEDALIARCEGLFGAGRGAAAVETYRRGRPGCPPGEVWTAVLTDQVFRVPAARLADQQAAHAAGVFTYLFSWPTPAFGGRLGSCHALEIPFVFDALDQPGVELFTGPPSAGMRHLAATMRDSWLAFARTGDPNHPGLPAWPRHQPGERHTMVFGDACEVVADPAGDELRLWAEPS